MGIYAINNLPSNLEYELSGYTLQDKICVNNQCSLGITKEFYITIKYKDGGYNASNTTYPLSLDIDFRSFHTVTYEGFTSTSSYPKEVIDGGDLIVNFTQRVPDVEIKIGNVSLSSNSYTFDSEQRYLYIPEGNITDDVTITFIADPPTITFALVDNSAINGNGWAKENFYVEATIVDNSGKGIASASSCATTSSTCTPNTSFTGNTKNFYITTEGSNVACVTATSNNGKSTTVCSDPYKLDKTAPTAGTATFTGTLGSNDWYTTNVTVNVRNGSDSLSGHSTTVSNVSSITSNTTGTTVRITTTDLAGNTSTRDYTIKVDKNSPTITANSGDVEIYEGDSNTVLSYFTIGYSTSGGVVNCSPTNTSSLSVGTQTVRCTVTGGNGKTVTASKSIEVLSTEPPTITFALVDNSVINSNGWAKENFYVEATIVDNSGKGIASASSCATTSSTCTPNTSFTGNTKNFYITTEGSNVACVTATSNNGKSTTVCSDPYKLDKTAPTAGTATFTGTLGSNDWYTTNVTVNVRNGSDSLSGHSTTVSNVSSITSNTTGTTVRITTTDLAGNSSTRDYTIKVDKNSPTFTSGPAVDTVEVYLNDSNVISNWYGVSYSTSGGSVSCTPENTNYFDLLGTYTATCTATGGNGKTASVTQSVKVLSNGLYEIFIKDAVADNISSTYVSSSSGINFSSPASTTNGLGVYKASSITSDSIYYYRGNVSNNNVIYANYCWKMVITTADRGVKLIYNGVPSNGSCTRTGTNTQIGTSAFNSIQTDNAYIGYMYGAPETSTIYGDVNDNGSVTATDYLLLKRFVICAQDYVIGDVNGDGRLTNADYLLLNRFINGTQTPTEEQEILGDVNNDGSLTSADSTLLSTYINSGAPTYDCTQTPTEEQELLGDVNLDGSLTTSDYIIVKNYVLNNINSIIDQNSDISRYNATHKNRNNSTIKSAIDSWYRSNMTSYTSDLEDAIWCNDRSKSSSYLGYGNWTTYYKAYNRSTPSLTCTNANDRFTVSTSNGNGALTYPVGLLTYDEYVLAGRTTGYLNSGSEWWTLTPYAYVASVSGSQARNYVGTSYYAVGTSKGVRPAIVLKYGAKRTSGSGTTSDPFVVD